MRVKEVKGLILGNTNTVGNVRRDIMADFQYPGRRRDSPSTPVLMTESLAEAMPRMVGETEGDGCQCQSWAYASPRRQSSPTTPSCSPMVRRSSSRKLRDSNLPVTPQRVLDAGIAVQKPPPQRFLWPPAPSQGRRERPRNTRGTDRPPPIYRRSLHPMS